MGVTHSALKVSRASVREYVELPINQLIEPELAARVSMDEQKLADLADSIKAMGILQPLIVVPVQMVAPIGAVTADGQTGVGTTPAAPRYEIVAGHRRYLASRLARLERLPCVVFDAREEALEAAKLHENIFREDLTAAEEGYFFCELLEKHKYTEDELSRAVQRTPQYIYARMELVQSDAGIAQLVAERKINFSVAREILKCPDPEHRAYLGRLATDSGATARVVIGWVAQWKAARQAPLPANGNGAEPGAPGEPQPNPLHCFVCGRDHDPANLKLLYIHWYELEGILRVLREAGLQVEAV